MRPAAKWTLAVGAIFVGLQFVPAEQTNPPVESEIEAPAEVREVLRQSCYDCHSHESVWPWYAKIAPASLLIADDVAEAREKLNFSAWNRLDEAGRRHMIHEVWEEVEEGEMPPWWYLPAHPSARLTEADLKILKEWSKAEAFRKSEEGPGALESEKPMPPDSPQGSEPPAS